MVAYDLPLAGVVVALAAANLLALHFLSRSMVDDNHCLLSESALAQGEAKQGLQMVDAYKASGSESLLLARLLVRQARLLNLHQRLACAAPWSAACRGRCTSSTAAVVLWIGGGRIIAGTMTVGALGAFQGLLAGFAGPAAQLVGLAAQIQDARATLALLNDTVRGLSAAGDTEVWEALRAAAMTDVAAAMPMRLRTVLTDGSRTLSGGQVQRLLIARTLL